MSRTALVIGGTGPTGPHVLNGLLDRGFDVTIFHRGTHEPPDLPEVPHLHGDPHFKETIDEALGGRTWDVVLAMYGRVRILAEVIEGRCEQFISIGGTPVYAGFLEPQLMRPYGLPIPVREDDAKLADHLGETDLVPVRFAQLMVATERAVFAHHPRGSCFRYPNIYGPRNPAPWEWTVIKRVLDGRSRMILPDGGHAIFARCAARNAAEFLLRAIDSPDAAAGQSYNVADQSHWSQRQWVELIAEFAGGSLEIVSLPSDIATEADAVMRQLVSPTSPWTVFSVEKAQRDLGYVDAIAPEDALEETVRWYVDNPVDLATTNPAFQDRFDYATEDALIEAYARARAEILAAVPQHQPTSLHGMPHPKQPGESDQRGR